MLNLKIFDKILGKAKTSVDKVDLRKHAKATANRIKTRTRLGDGLKDDARGSAKKKLKKLQSKNYKKYREKTDKLSEFTTAGMSNLTFTGQLLDSIFGKVKGRKIVIDMKEDRNDGKKNSDIVAKQSKLGRPFFELSSKELKGLQNDIKKEIISNIRKK